MLEPLNHAQVVGAPELWSNLIRWRRSVPETPPPGVLEAVFAVVTLRLLIGEALMQDIPAGAFDAIYFDAFSPSSNPELWTESFLAGLFTR